MAKTLFSLLFLAITWLCHSQTMMTLREVYDFDINDEFHSHTLNATPNVQRYKIIDKRVSANNDTVVYVRQYNNYGSTFYPNPQPHMVYSFSSGIDSVRYSQLDSTIQYKTWPTDSCSTFHDTLYYSNTYCGAEVYQYDGGTGMCFEGQTTEEIYGKGLGWLGHHFSYPSQFYDVQWTVFYYYKASNGATCGTADTLSGLTEIKGRSADMVVSPNPARGLVKVNSGSEQETTVVLLDVTGKVLMTRKETRDNFSVDVSDLAEGIYFVQIKDASGVRSKRIIVQH